ncbi:hypothetical protein [Tautonia rosea]|nr:hypothetical protein [Tautonia rosea]
MSQRDFPGPDTGPLAMVMMRLTVTASCDGKVLDPEASLALT